MRSTQRHPQNAVPNEAGQRLYRRPVLRDIAQEFPPRRRAVCLQLGRPVAGFTCLQVETGVVPAADEPEIAGESAVARNLASGGRADGAGAWVSLLEERQMQMRTGVVACEVPYALAQNDEIELFQLEDPPLAVVDLVCARQARPIAGRRDASSRGCPGSRAGPRPPASSGSPRTATCARWCRSRTRMKSATSTSASICWWSASEISSRVPASLLAPSMRLATLTVSPIAVSLSSRPPPSVPITAGP